MSPLGLGCALIRTRWLNEVDAGDRNAIRRAIAAMLAASARRQ
jgi:hypothetical protein